MRKLMQDLHITKKMMVAYLNDNQIELKDSVYEELSKKIKFDSIYANDDNKK